MRDEQRLGGRTGRQSGSRVKTMRAVALAALMFVAPAIAAAAPVAHKETRIPRIDRRAVENLQRWVNGGHDAWCTDASEVALVELRRIAPDFSGDRLDLVSLTADARQKAARRAEFTWTSLDGSASYRITLQRFDWLKPLASKPSNMVWVPSRIEITHAEQAVPHKRAFPELPKACKERVGMTRTLAAVHDLDALGVEACAAGEVE